MRILFTIPHYYGPPAPDAKGCYGAHGGDPEARFEALSSCLCSLHQLFGRAQYIMQLAHGRTRPANEEFSAEVHVVVCTTGRQHLLDRLAIDRSFYHHHATQAEPTMLGFECHAMLRDRWGNYDYYGYLEDDLVLHDPWLFVKLEWFIRQFGQDKLLLPNRFERGLEPLVGKAYVDGDLSESATEKFQNVQEEPQLKARELGVPLVFQRPPNPHSGCFFLSAEQMGHWIRQPHFLDRSTAFIGPLESAATLSIMRTFAIYKPARQNAGFLEIEHHGRGFLSQLRRPSSHE